MADLSNRELAVMRVLWQRGPMTARGVQQALPLRLDNSTVRTFLRILERKGHITHDKRGRSFVFQARTDYDQATRRAVDLLLDGFFDGSLDALLEWSHAVPPPARRRRRRTRAGTEDTPIDDSPRERPQVEASPREEPWLL